MPWLSAMPMKPFAGSARSEFNRLCLQPLSIRTSPVFVCKMATSLITLNGPRHMTDYLIAPSILSADFARLGEEVNAVLDAGADVIHFDVMDNHYVPNLTIGPMVCEALRKHKITAPIDVHLMVSPVDQLIVDFAKAGASYISFHPEATAHVDRSLQLIRDQGCKSGLVFNPGTPLDCLEYLMDKIDVILLMSVNPGFGGQKFIPSTLKKLQNVRKLIDESEYSIRLEVDGGVGIKNIRQIADAGADMFVAGSAIFNSNDYAKTISEMRAQLGQNPDIHH
jgi:ribulose-phosphate 3-epimerase